MDFSLNDDQSMLRDSVQRFVQGSYDFEQRRNKVKALTPVDAEVWSQFAKLGWLAMPFDEADGGLGFGPVETMILMEELGRGLVVEPYVASVVLGGGLLRRYPVPDRDHWVQSLIAGDTQLALAVDEPGRAHGLAGTTLRAEKTPDGWRLEGEKALVLNGDQADRLLVVARTDGQVGERHGLSLFWVDPASEGVVVAPHRTVDGQQAARIRFQQACLDESALLGEPHMAAESVGRVLDEGVLALGAEVIGIVERLLRETVEYSKTRKQFGMPIGGFQALQHRMANMFMAVEQGRSLLLAATLKHVEGHDDARALLHAFKHWLGQGGRLVGQEAIQMHGGMGMTDELAIGHYFKRLTAIDLLFGTAGQHLNAYAEVSVA